MRERGIIMSADSVLGIMAGRKTVTRRLVNLAQLRVRLRREVRSDLPGLGLGDITAPAGVYGAVIHEAGAVSVLVPRQRNKAQRPLAGTPHLGVKPGEFDFVCPYAEGKTRLAYVGDRKAWTIVPKASRLWVKETWYDDIQDDAPGERARDDEGNVEGLDYRATHQCTNYEAGCPCNPEGGFPKRSDWKSSMFMPRWASRLLLDVTDVRLERLHDLTEEDAKAEGLRAEPELKKRPGDAPGVYGSVRFGTPKASDYAPLAADAHRQAYARLWDELNYKRAPWHANPWVWAIAVRRVDITPALAHAMHEERA